MNGPGGTARLEPRPGGGRRGLAWGTALGVVAGVLALAPAAQAATTRDVDASDPACGTTGHPYCTIHAAASAAVSGDTVSVASGTYNETVRPAQSGVTYTAPSGATVDGGGTLGTGFVVRGVSDIVISGFTFAHQTTAGVSFDNATNSVLRNAQVSASGSYGVLVNGGSGVTVTQVHSSGNNSYGVLLKGTAGGTVSSSTADHNGKAGVGVQGGSGNTVEGVHATGNDSGADGATTRLAPGIEISQGSSNVTIQRNVSTGNDDSGIQVYGSTGIVRRNITSNNGDHGIDISQASTASVISNTVLGNTTSGINVESTSAGAGSTATVRDNIAVDNGVNSPRTTSNIRVDAHSSATLDHDVLFVTQGGVLIDWHGPNYSSLASFRSATGQETHGRQADPALDPSGVPGPGSPAVDAADSSVSGWTGTDQAGHGPFDDPGVANTGSGNPTYADIGALERTSSTPRANQAPTARLSATPATLTAGQASTLDASGSTDPDGDSLNYAFTCGNGSTSSGAAHTTSCSYPQAGSFHATVTVTDPAGASSSATQTVTVNDAAPVGPTALLRDGQTRQGEWFRLDARASHGNSAAIDHYVFRCGNHKVGPRSGPRARCHWRHRGLHRVTVRVVDTNGMADVAHATVRVRRGIRPVAVLSMSANTVRPGELVTMSAAGSQGTRVSQIAAVRFRCGNHHATRWLRHRMTASCQYHHPRLFKIQLIVRSTLGLRDRQVAYVRVRG